MLSFDYSPLMIQNQFPGLDLYPHSRVRPTRRYGCAHQGAPQCHSQRSQCRHDRRPRHDAFEQYFKLYEALPKVEVQSRVLKSGKGFQIQVMKQNDPQYSFKDYEITYKKTVGGETLISIQSEKDNFEVTYSFNTSAIDIKNVEWRSVENFLVIDVPEVKASNGISSRSAKKAELKEKNTKQRVRKIKIETPKSQSRQSTVVSVPDNTKSYPEGEVKVRSTPSSPVLSAYDSEASTTDSEVETSSETESYKSARSHDGEPQPSTKIPKLSRKVSIEEVEDESLQ